MRICILYKSLFFNNSRIQPLKMACVFRVFLAKFPVAFIETAVAFVKKLVAPDQTVVALPKKTVALN